MPWFIFFTLMLFIAPADVHTVSGTATPRRIKAVSASISMAHLLAYTRRSQFG